MDPKNLTDLLQAANSGDSSARTELVRTVYEDLRALAVGRMRNQRQDHTLTATALVHEVSIRLLGSGATPENRTEFFAYATRAMRNLLVDHARERSSQKRGGGRAKISLEPANLGSQEQDDEVLALNEVLEKLAAFDARKAEIVEMRYFGGLTNLEIANVLEVSEGTVKRDWDLARAWLKRSLQ